jgi:hypothetical protein
VALLATLVQGCATRDGAASRSASATGDAPATLANEPRLLPIEAWPIDVSLRQRVRIRWGAGAEEEARFDAVLEKRAGVLLLVGLDPLARPGFVLRAEAGTIEVSNRSGRPLPFDPAHVIADVQRVFYPWNVDGMSPDVRLTETYSGRRVERRTFSRPQHPDSGTIQVSYQEGWLSPSRVPRRAVVRNEWYGYTLEVETLEATPLPPAARDDSSSDGGNENASGDR